MKKTFNILTLIFMFAVIVCTAKTARAEELTANISLSSGGDASDLKSQDRSSYLTFSEGNTITVTAAGGEMIYGIYVIWDTIPVEWSLGIDSGTLECGKNGFLHEYVAITAGTNTAVINIPKDSTRICNIRIFGEGDLPGDVQVWQTPCSRADFLVIATHADDDILFLGGIAPTYGMGKGADVQVIYTTQFWDTNHIREHEKLDGLWVDGVRHYPISGSFTDLYSETREEAEWQYDLTDYEGYIVENIRRFQPQIVVTHDFGGEYGHGCHQLTAYATSLALTDANDESKYSESAANYGVWDVPKAYFHLYAENSLTLDLRQPIDALGGQTALEAATAAYKQHVSQQWCWFYVDDEYQYSCAKFGLYKTTVGADTTGSMLDNIVLYKYDDIDKEKLESEDIAQPIPGDKEWTGGFDFETYHEYKVEEEKKAAEEALKSAGILHRPMPKILVYFIIAVLMILAVLSVLLTNNIKPENKNSAKKKINSSSSKRNPRQNYSANRPVRR